MQKVSMLAVFCLLVSACGTMKQAPDTTFYLFDADPLAQQHKATDVRIKLEKINLPDYLSSNQLVMRKSGHLLIKANYHSWADSLDESIQRALLNDLNSMHAESEFVVWCSPCDSISVTIEHFYPSAEGKLLLSGFFEISKSEGENKLSYFQLEDELILDGYANAVKQMRAQISELAAKINQNL